MWIVKSSNWTFWHNFYMWETLLQVLISKNHRMMQGTPHMQQFHNKYLCVTCILYFRSPRSGIQQPTLCLGGHLFQRPVRCPLLSFGLSPSPGSAQHLSDAQPWTSHLWSVATWYEHGCFQGYWLERGRLFAKKCKMVLRTGGCYEWVDGSAGVQYHPLALVLLAASLEEDCDDGVYEFGRFLSNRADCISQSSAASGRIIGPKILKHNSWYGLVF